MWCCGGWTWRRCGALAACPPSCARHTRALPEVGTQPQWTPSEWRYHASLTFSHNNKKFAKLWTNSKSTPGRKRNWKAASLFYQEACRNFWDRNKIQGYVRQGGDSVRILIGPQEDIMRRKKLMGWRSGQDVEDKRVYGIREKAQIRMEKQNGPRGLN